MTTFAATIAREKAASFAATTSALDAMIELLRLTPAPDRVPTDPWFVPQGPRNTVRVIRHTHDCFEVEAFDMFGARFRHRMYCYGRGRRGWALEQARQWADTFTLWLDETVYH